VIQELALVGGRGFCKRNRPPLAANQGTRKRRAVFCPAVTTALVTASRLLVLYFREPAFHEIYSVIGRMVLATNR
jgi:hypothetical protein